MQRQEKGKGRGRGRGAIPKQQNGGGNIRPGDCNGPPQAAFPPLQDAFPPLQSDFPPLQAGLPPQVVLPEAAKIHVEECTKVSPGRGRGRKNGNISPASIPEHQMSCLSVGTESTDVSHSESPLSSPEPSKTLIEARKDEKTFKMLARPGFGKAGRPIDLVTNYFQIQHKVQNKVYQYYVDINSLDQIKKYGKQVPRMTNKEAYDNGVSRVERELDRFLGRLKCREIFGQLVKMKALEAYHPIFDDAKNLYTMRPLPFFNQGNPKVQFEIAMELQGRTRKYEVVVQAARKVDGTNEVDFATLSKTFEGQIEMMSVLNAIMNHRNVGNQQIQLGRSFFYLNQERKTDLGEGLEIWYGYNQNIHLTQRGLAIVINLSAKAFHKSGPVIEYINEILKKDITRSDFKNYDKMKVEEALKGVKVNVTHLAYPRKFTIQAVSKQPASQMRMNMDGKDISIADYYGIKYRRLNFPNLPCFLMKSNKPTYIPFENCTICEGQPKLGKMSPAGTSKMIRSTAIPPIQRFASIEQSAASVRKESGEKMNSYKLLMDLKPMHVKGRVIDAPQLKYNSSVSNPDNRGVWRMERMNFFKPSQTIQSWILLCFDDRRQVQQLQQFVDTFVQAGKSVGLDFGRFLGIRKFGNRDQTDKVLREAENTKASFAVIVLSRFDNVHNYDEIKFIADYRLGFVTQCVDSAILDRMNPQISTNLCLKVNTKLGGVNHILQQRPRVFSKPVMVVGADAVHSMRDSPCPSIAAVVGSMDAFPSKYKVECRVQSNKNVNKQSQEIIVEMREMMVSMLKAFHANVNGKFPERIIFFRDGVSEGQFKLVRDAEVYACQQASEEVVGYIIPMTYVIVQKRHQTRLRPQNPRDGVNKNGNVPPGTTVDTDITHPDRFDYFLNSHEGIQGTSKPAHYTVLYDDNGFGADELQSLSYHLCYTYSKCNRSISIPAPVMYADLACYRAKKYADFHLARERENASRSSDTVIQLPVHVQMAINGMGDYKNSMFFV